MCVNEISFTTDMFSVTCTCLLKADMFSIVMGTMCTLVNFDPSCLDSLCRVVHPVCPEFGLSTTSVVCEEEGSVSSLFCNLHHVFCNLNFLIGM